MSSRPGVPCSLLRVRSKWIAKLAFGGDFILMVFFRLCDDRVSFYVHVRV